MDLALIVSALLMGLAGTLHCVAMCGAASAAAVRSCGNARIGLNWSAFHIGRLASYGVAGALVASSVSALAWLGNWSPALRPLWVLAHLAAFALGAWLLIKGRQPEWLDRLGRDGQRATGAAQASGGWQRIHGPVRALGVGGVWAAWPCGLLQSAFLVAALANGPWAGAAVMITFGATSALALGIAPALFVRLSGGHAALGGRTMVWLVRLSGAALAGASAWALGHDLFMEFVGYCLS